MIGSLLQKPREGVLAAAVEELADALLQVPESGRRLEGATFGPLPGPAHRGGDSAHPQVGRDRSNERQRNCGQDEQKAEYPEHNDAANQEGQRCDQTNQETAQNIGREQHHGEEDSADEQQNQRCDEGVVVGELPDPSSLLGGFTGWNFPEHLLSRPCVFVHSRVGRLQLR